MNFTAYAMLLLVVVIGVAGQLLLKQGMLQHTGTRLVDMLALVRNVPVIAGFACYGASTLLYFKVLSELELSLAYPTISLGYVLVLLLSRLFFGERVSRARWSAAGIICLGVAMVGLGTN